MDFKRCSICRKEEATKTNSHLIPSFLVTMISSRNYSNKRDTEILYEVGTHVTNVYIGRSVSQKALEENFDNISDERILELSHNNVAMDYIFCPHCEKKLGEYLESPYSEFLLHGKKITSDIPYMFWVSILWRISYYDIMGEAKLKTHQEASLRNRINSYMKAKDSNDSIASIFNVLPFQYRILYCQGFSKNASGFHYGRYDKCSKILSIFFGDIILCFHFDSTEIPYCYHFYGLEEEFRKTTLNDGSILEQRYDISKEVMQSAVGLLLVEAQSERLKNNRQQVIELWKRLRVKATWLPKEPHEAFIRSSIHHLYSDEAKVGERITYAHFAQAIANAFKDIYGIIISD